jgi:hypothetical protein
LRRCSKDMRRRPSLRIVKEWAACIARSRVKNNKKLIRLCGRFTLSSDSGASGAKGGGRRTE